MKITLAQLNPLIGDFRGNLSKMRQVVSSASTESSDLVIFSELFPSGYPPKDWLTKDGFIKDYAKAADGIISISNEFPETAILYGGLDYSKVSGGKSLYNSAFLIQAGELLFTQHKTLLPTYDVFDEARYFKSAETIDIVSFHGLKIGITICEDMWNEPDTFPNRPYTVDPVAELVEKGAELIINISASPFGIEKDKIRYEIVRNHAVRHQVPVVLVNQTGANDDLISDGRSMMVDAAGQLHMMLPAFQESVQTIDMELLPPAMEYEEVDQTESAYQALILGVRDYAVKCGFTQAVLGLSGGVDSALTCCIAVEALGAENVFPIYMPSPYSSPDSGEDAEALAKNLGTPYQEISISSLFDAYRETLKSSFANLPEGITEENIQARIRGNIVMAQSNKFGYLALASGNKSEMSVGYCTLYGDMCGGLSVLADVSKTMVYKICNSINQEREIIPSRILQKEPSAELRPDQKDSDSLPPYDILDGILSLYIEELSSREAIIEQGYDADTVDWIINAVKKNEYKRVQAAPGLKICSRSFGSGRRIPIAAKWE